MPSLVRYPRASDHLPAGIPARRVPTFEIRKLFRISEFGIRISAAPSRHLPSIPRSFPVSPRSQVVLGNASVAAKGGATAEEVSSVQLYLGTPARRREGQFNCRDRCVPKCNLGTRDLFRCRFLRTSEFELRTSLPPAPVCPERFRGRHWADRICDYGAGGSPRS